MGNRELLVVKLALEEWRHWLEGSVIPFIVWTDHKNLVYIQTARWALFFFLEDSTSHSLIAPDLRIPSLMPSPVSSPQKTHVPS